MFWNRLFVSKWFNSLKDYQTNRVYFFFRPFNSDLWSFFKRFIVLYRHATSRQYATFILNPDFFQGRLLPHKACLIKLQRSGVFKEYPDRDMIFALYIFCFWPIRCSTPTLKVCWWTSFPSHLHLGIFWHVFYESLNAWTSLFSPGPIGLLQNANNATQHGLSDSKKAYSYFLADLVSSCKFIKLQHMLAITHSDRYHCGVSLSKYQPF